MWLSNPVGSYIRDFELPEGWLKDNQVFVRLNGVASAFYLWINGEKVGYGEDSFSPDEFNITKYLTPGMNSIAVEVYRFSDGSYLERNPVGSYLREFELPEGWLKDGQVFVRLNGVASAFYLWINGEKVGYAEDSFSPDEFNITKYLTPGTNSIAVEVYRFSDGSYLEDQAL